MNDNSSLVIGVISTNQSPNFRGFWELVELVDAHVKCREKCGWRRYKTSKKGKKTFMEGKKIEDNSREMRPTELSFSCLHRVQLRADESGFRRFEKEDESKEEGNKLGYGLSDIDLW